MSIKNGDMPAMPQPSEWTGSKGLTKREQFAAMAMQGLLSSYGNHDVTYYSEIASDSIMAADALLAQLEEKGDE